MHFEAHERDASLFLRSKERSMNWHEANGDIIICLDKYTALNDCYVKFIEAAYVAGFNIVQIQLYDEVNTIEISKFIRKFQDMKLSFEILSSAIYSNEQPLIDIFDEFRSIYRLCFFSSGKFSSTFDQYGRVLEYVDTPLSMKSCGNISSKGFVPTRRFITLAKNANSCLYNKLAIDVRGCIRNCPSMPMVYGKIGESYFEDIIKLTHFQEVASIRKDDIEICRDCEFRYICTDCRAYINKPEEPNSKPLKCGYDPYSGEWSNWRNISNELTMMYYDL